MSRCLTQIKPHISLDYEDMTYYPIVWFNEFWLLRDKLLPLNESVTEVPLQLSVHPLAMWKFTIYLQMEQSFSMQARTLLSRLIARRSLVTAQCNNAGPFQPESWLAWRITSASIWCLCACSANNCP